MVYKKCILFLLVMLFLFPIANLNAMADSTTAHNTRPAKSNTKPNKDIYIHGYNEIAQSSELILYFNKKDSSLAIKSKTNGFIWTSSVSDNEVDVGKLNNKIKGDISSLFILNYTPIGTSGSSVISSSLINSNTETSFENMQNGIRVNYYFTDIGIGFAVEITLENSMLKIKVPADSIIEEGNMKLVSIEMMPYFGASNNEQDGYIFYPDGSGAVMEFTDLNHHGENKKSWHIYGTDISDLFSLNQKDLKRSNIDDYYESLMMPVFGIKRGNNAFLAIVEEGDAVSKINLRPSNNILNLNSISCEFIYRNSFNDPRVKSRSIKQFDKDIISVDHSIKYVFLEGENADYSGMANSYRTYLLETGKIEKRIDKNDKIPLALDLFMGIKEKGMLLDKYIAMTTFEEAQSIMEYLLNAGVEQIQTQLKGWTKKGYYTEPIYFPPNRRLGGKRGLSNLSNFAKANNIKLCIAVNPIFATASNGGFSKRNDVIYLGNQTILTDADEELFCLTPSVVYEKYCNHISPSAISCSVFGISMEGIGHYLYYDYNKGNYSNKEQTKNTWTEILQQATKEFDYVMVNGGNAYVLGSVDRLAGIPTEDSGYYFTTKSIPFYQMVVHGLLPYSSDIAGNLSSSFQKEKLKWIEKGYMPYFELTYRTADLIKYTEYKKLFTSSYSDWIDKAVDVYKELNREIGDIWSEYIVKHEELYDNVIRVSYSNGTQIIINYNDKDIKVDGLTVKGLDYLVIKGEM